MNCWVFLEYFRVAMIFFARNVYKCGCQTIRMLSIRRQRRCLLIIQFSITNHSGVLWIAVTVAESNVRHVLWFLWNICKRWKGSWFFLWLFSINVYIQHGFLLLLLREDEAYIFIAHQLRGEGSKCPRNRWE